MTLAETVQRLRAHPDASRMPSGDKARAEGFQALGIFGDGVVRVTYHWGCRTFCNLEELHGWLNGETPRSWQL